MSLKPAVSPHPVPEPLPESPRVIYARNPLFGVICQVRFPPVLRIVSEPPVAFQERVRADYPLLAEKYPDPKVEIPPRIPPEIAEAIRSTLPAPKLTGYDFTSADERWRVSVTKEFLALTATEYRQWEEFRGHLDQPLKALVDIYAPAFFTRIGLRYQNLIRKSKLNFSKTTSWAALLKPHIAGILGMPDLAQAVEGSYSQALIRLPQYKGKVRVQFGIVQATDTDEESFLIDNDFYTEERTNISDVDSILSYFNRQSGKLFRWCIVDRLHEAMEPSPVKARA